MSSARKPNAALSGQSRRAVSLGANDPRIRRSAGNFTAPEHYIGPGLEKDKFGRLKVIDELLALAGRQIRVSLVGGGLFPWWGYKVGRWYRDPMLLDAAGLAMVADRLYLAPLAIYEAVMIDRIGFYVSTAGAVGKKARVGLYYEGAAGAVGLIRYDAGEILVDSTGEKEVTFEPITLGTGAYWLAFVTNGTPSCYAIRDNVDQYSPVGYGALSDDTAYPCYYGTHTYAVLPPDGKDFNTVSLTAANYPPALAVRIYRTGVPEPDPEPGTIPPGSRIIIINEPNLGIGGLGPGVNVNIG